MFVFLMIAIITVDLLKRHDSSAFYIHFAMLLCIALPIGLFTIFFQNRKYFKIAAYTLQLLGFGGLSVEQWHHGSHITSIFAAVVCVFALIILTEEIVKLSCNTGIKE
jgi:uncharacterized membrane protein YccC